MLIIQLLFVATSLITQAIIFREPAAPAHAEASAHAGDRTSQVNTADLYAAGDDRSPAETDSMPNAAAPAPR